MAYEMLWSEMSLKFKIQKNPLGTDKNQALGSDWKESATTSGD